MEHKPPKREPPVSFAIASLEKAKLEVLERAKLEVAELDAAILRLRRDEPKQQTKSNGKTNGHPVYGDPYVVGTKSEEGLWQGMGMTDAVIAFLSNYNDPIPFVKLLTELQARGVKMGDPAKPNRYQANLKTTVVNNKRFRYNKKADTVSLVRPLELEVSASAR